MNARGWTLVAILLALGLIGFSLWKFWPSEAPQEELPTLPSEELSGKSLYASGEYGFIVAYPESAAIEEGSFTHPHLASSWRANALPDATGTPILSVVPYEIENETSYPRFYVTAARVGASDDPKEVAVCEKATERMGEEALPDRVLNGTTWKAFSFGDAAMMRYQRGVSYRTLRDGRCYALEALVAGSSYREEASPEDIPESVLSAEYAKLDEIVSSFMFSSP